MQHITLSAPDMTYTELFCQWRQQSGLSQDELARKAGCHRNTVINLEDGCVLRFNTLTNLVRAMGRTEQEIHVIAMLWFEDMTGLSLAHAGPAFREYEKVSGPRKRLLETLNKSARKMTLTELKAITHASQRKEVLMILRSIHNPESLKES